MSEITLNSDQQKILDEIEKKNGKGLFFIEGAPGTGKTAFAKVLMKWYAEKYPIDTIKVTSHTGIAASNATSGTKFRGQTIHSLFKIGIESKSEKGVQMDISKDFNVLFVDEVSMLPLSLFKLMNKVLQRDKKNNKPFGDIPVYLLGDFKQLSPINDKSIQESDIFTQNFKKMELIKHVRNDNLADQELLTRIRNHNVRQEDINTLKSLIRPSPDPLSLHIMGVNKKIDTHNEEIITDHYLPWYTPIELEMKKIIHPYGKQCYTIDRYIESFLMENSIKKKLLVKPGCRVMCRRNCQLMGVDGNMHTIYNGMMGKVISIVTVKLETNETDTELIVNFNSYDINIMVRRIAFEFKTKGRDPKPIATIYQFPLHLCYAITPWKSQGQTFDEPYVISYLPQKKDYSGFYVMMTRATSLKECIYITNINFTREYFEQASQRSNMERGTLQRYFSKRIRIEDS